MEGQRQTASPWFYKPTWRAPLQTAGYSAVEPACVPPCYLLVIALAHILAVLVKKLHKPANELITEGLASRCPSNEAVDRRFTKCEAEYDSSTLRSVE